MVLLVASTRARRRWPQQHSRYPSHPDSFPPASLNGVCILQRCRCLCVQYCALPVVAVGITGNRTNKTDGKPLSALPLRTTAWVAVAAVATAKQCLSWESSSTDSLSRSALCWTRPAASASTDASNGIALPPLVLVYFCYVAKGQQDSGTDAVTGVPRSCYSQAGDGSGEAPNCILNLPFHRAQQRRAFCALLSQILFNNLRYHDALRVYTKALCIALPSTTGQARSLQKR